MTSPHALDTNCSPGGARVRRVKPGDWRIHHTRARETLRALQRSAEAGEWSAVIAIAPVCAIAGAQAVVARQGNVMSRPDDYNTAIELLLIHGAGLPDLEEATGCLRQIQERKVTVQHGAEPASEPLAREIMGCALRFATWMEQQLTSHSPVSDASDLFSAPDQA